MSDRKNSKTAIVITAAVLVAAALFLAGKPEVSPQETARGVEAMASMEINDRELLSEEQKREARETGRAAFYDNGVNTVVEDMPEEYYREER